MNILRSLQRIGSERKIPVVVPLHPRTMKILENLHSENPPGLEAIQSQIRIIPAVSFFDMIKLESASSVILTDSGGVQKEAWFLEKPVVVLREETEWVEIIEAGNGTLTGPDPDRIHASALAFLDHPPTHFPPLFGEGRAAAEILRVIASHSWKY
jgi:UDP-GlcNAc3NAcA epimerase